MKKIKNLFPVLIILLGALSFSFAKLSSDALINTIASSIRNANANAVASHFANNVELLLPDNEGTYSKTQAEGMLRTFFNQNAPSSFTVNHQGSSRDGSKYAIGTYLAKDGKRYRTYFLIKKVSNNYMLHQLQFELQ